MNHEYEQLINKLTNLYFSKQEASVYLYLLNNPGQTVYQISKDLNISRSSIYPTIENMYKKGIVLSMTSENQKYFSENPKTLFRKLKENYSRNTDEIIEDLEKINPNQETNFFINIIGYNACIEKSKEIISKATKEVYLNTDFDLTIFDKELALLEEKKVRVIYFSFTDIAYNRLNMEKFSYGFKPNKSINPTRIMIVSDFQEAFVASISNNNWLGFITNNHFTVTMISEHIHHDIYLSRIEKQSKINYFNSKDNVFIDSIMEKESFNARKSKQI